MKEFVNIHCHTSLGSMLDALISVDDLFDKVKEIGQTAVAITDHGTLAAHYDAFQAYKRTGVKFIPGCEIYFVHSYDFLPKKEGEKGKRKRERGKHLVLLAKNEIGYKNLLKVNHIGFEHGVLIIGKVYPRVNWDVIERYSEGLIATSACVGGILSNYILNDQYDKACEAAQRLASIYTSGFYIEIQPHSLEDGKINQHLVNQQLINIAQKFGIPLVVGVDIHYVSQESEKYHDTLLAIKEAAPVDDPNRFRYEEDQYYVKTVDEIYDFLVSHYGKDVAEESMANTVKIAAECEFPEYLEVSGNHLPIFEPKMEKDYEEFLVWQSKAKIKGPLKEDAAFMRFRIFKGFKRKLKNLSREEMKNVLLRIKGELAILEGNNFSSYMLIVSDFIKWAKDNDILVGPGRGSAGGSMVAYLLDIHEVNPIEYGLLFERFQNAYKKDLPDIDTDFTSAGRDKVQEYCRDKYGADHCAQVSNINTYTPKNVIPALVKSMRNVMPGLIPDGTSYVAISNAIKKVIPEKDADGKKIKTLEHAMSLSPKLRDFSTRCPELMEYADALIGLPREFSTHAAGMVISDIPIVEFAPLRIDKKGSVAVQYEKNRCESIGLVKMDFLAISTLDVIHETFKNIEYLGAEGPKNMEDIPLDDLKTYKMIQDGNTRCVFQLGKSSMMISLCKSIKPKCITDIAIINALGRPSSSAEECKEFIGRHSGKRGVSYLHPSLETSLKETYGLGLFEEQLMGVAKDVAGWGLDKADGLRKLTKLKGKNPKLALQLEVDFIEGTMNEHSISYEKAKEIWDKVVLPFAGYGFNKCLESFNFLLTPLGWKSLNNIKTNDTILSFDEKTNKTIKTSVKDIGKTDRKMPIYELRFNSGGIIRVTPNHKLLTPYGMKEVGEIIENALPVKKIHNMENVDWLNDNDGLYGETRHLIKESRKNGLSVGKIAKKHNISKKKVMTILKGGVNNRKHNCTNQFQSGIHDEETAYWFGFLCADGHIGKYKLQLSLANYDFAHIEKFSQYMGDTTPFYELRYRNNSRCVSYDVNDKNITQTLKDLGIPHNKDKYYMDISFVPEQLFRHFIRGYFDGDGSFAIFKYKGDRINFGLRGPHHILEKIKIHLRNNIDGLYDVKINNDGSHSLWFRSYKSVVDIGNYLYNDSTIFLPRKRIKLERFINKKVKYKPQDNLFRSATPEGFTTIKTIEYVGLKDTYYVEVDDENHNYILDGGIVSANSHAVFYSINGYVTAYLKCHYPSAFLAAYLKIKTAGTGLNRDSEIAMAKGECKRIGIKIIPPDINRSGLGYEVLDDDHIVMGFAAIKGLGPKGVQEVFNNQPYDTFTDFIRKTQGKIINKTKMEALAKSGCFDLMDIPRKDVHDFGKKNRDKFNIWVKKNILDGEVSDGYNISKINDEFPLKFEGNEWGEQEKLRYENDVLGELVSGTLNDLYPGFFTGINSTLISNINSLPNRQDINVEFLILELLREFKIKSGRYAGQKMIKYRVSDVLGDEIELTVWPSEYDVAKRVMLVGRPIRAQCQVSEFNGDKSIMLRRIETVYS